MFQRNIPSQSNIHYDKKSIQYEVKENNRFSSYVLEDLRPRNHPGYMERLSKNVNTENNLRQVICIKILIIR